jgi:ABC-type uncharacterized transport system substrate-binding protein
LLKELVPAISRLADLYNPANLGDQAGLQAYRASAPALGIQLVDVPMQAPEELEGAFQMIISTHADALNIAADAVTLGQLTRILDFAVAIRLPTTSLVGAVAEGVLRAMDLTASNSSGAADTSWTRSCAAFGRPSCRWSNLPNSISR